MSTRVPVHQVHHDGAEDVVVAPRGRHEGSVYTGTVDGAVLRVRPDGSVEQVGSTGGRPLGLEIDPEGRLLVCDAHRGLLRMDPDTGAVERLLAEVDGTAMVFTNNAAIGSDGTDEGGTDPGTEEPGTGTDSGAYQEALSAAQQALADREAALKDGDLTAFAEADKRLTDAVTELLALEEAAGE